VLDTRSNASRPPGCFVLTIRVVGAIAWRAAYLRCTGTGLKKGRGWHTASWCNPWAHASSASSAPKSLLAATGLLGLRAGDPRRPAVL